jgi:hypothetical protein
VTRFVAHGAKASWRTQVPDQLGLTLWNVPEYSMDKRVSRSARDGGCDERHRRVPTLVNRTRSGGVNRIEAEPARRNAGCTGSPAAGVGTEQRGAPRLPSRAKSPGNRTVGAREQPPGRFCFFGFGLSSGPMESQPTAGALLPCFGFGPSSGPMESQPTAGAVVPFGCGGSFLWVRYISWPNGGQVISGAACAS